MLNPQEKDAVYACVEIMRKKPEHLLPFIGDVINGSSSYKAMAEGVTDQHRTLQARTVTMMLQTIWFMGQQNDTDTDLRNEIAVKRCREISEAMDELHDTKGGKPFWINVEGA